MYSLVSFSQVLFVWWVGKHLGDYHAFAIVNIEARDTATTRDIRYTFELDCAKSFN